MALGETFTTIEGDVVSLFETQTGDVRHQIAKSEAEIIPTKGELLVEAGRYFMMGDFRTNSNDSRYWGTVREQELIGPVVRRYLSGRSESGGIVWEDLRVAR